MANPNMIVGGPPVNPKGRPPGIIHSLSERRNRFLAELTGGEILALAADKERLNNEYKAFDAQVILGLAETLMDIPEAKLDPSAAREKMYDRELGKSAQTVHVNQTSINLNFFKMERETETKTGELIDQINETAKLAP